MSAIDCPTCQGRGYLLSDPPLIAHNRYDLRCTQREPNDPLKSGEICTKCAISERQQP